MLINTKLLKIRNLKIQGYTISLNGANLIADNLFIKSFNGKLEIKNATITNKAYLEIDKGNVVF